MKKHRLFITLLLTVLAVSSALAGDIIKVCGQNVENFFYSTSLTTEEARQEKMNAILNAYFPEDNSVAIADIYAFCEVESSDDIMKYIAFCFKAKTGINPNRSLGPISLGDIKVFSCSPESKECLSLVHRSYKT